MASTSDRVLDSQRAELRATLSEAFESEIAARATGTTNRPSPGTPVASDCRALMQADKEPVRMAALTICMAKASYPDIDAQALQAGEVDFRSRAKDTVVPYLLELANRENVTVKYKKEPLVSNPYREKKLDDEWVERRRGEAKVMGQHLLNIATFLNANPSEAPNVLAELVADIIDRWGTQSIAYPIPGRVSHAVVMDALRTFLSDVAGGTRLEWVSLALLRFVGEKWGGWDNVVGHESSDSAPYDAECYLGDSLVAIAESKDQRVVEVNVRQLADEMRAQGVTLGFLFTRREHLVAHGSDVHAIVAREHGFGGRIQVLDIFDAATAWLALADVADEDLVHFLRILCLVLDDWSGLGSRREWAMILGGL